jgi:hypothetical protein
VPGLKLYEVCDWLYHLEPNENIEQATFHVGVNNCPGGTVSEAEWKDLISLSRKAFPCAAIRLSSIIPGRGRQNINNSIFPSNHNMQRVCQQENATYIDNAPTFMTKNGAPRQALYRDIIHPSARGTALLALNLAPLSSKDHLSQHYYHVSSQKKPDSYTQQSVSFGQESTVYRDNFPHLPNHSQREPPMHSLPSNNLDFSRAIGVQIPSSNSSQIQPQQLPSLSPLQQQRELAIPSAIQQLPILHPNTIQLLNFIASQQASMANLI